MIRVLWADDQQDVIRTLSGLLRPLKPEITMVKSGTEAIEALGVNQFDILILDLMMPPNKWGGLWLLEEIRKARILVPVLVLSGEGDQSETIQALRLGARDYVTKDQAQDELVQRIQAILEEFAGHAETVLASSLLTPLALPFKRFLNSEGSVSQLRRLVEVYESGLRLCGVVGLCELAGSSNASIDAPQLVTQLLRGPSMGVWNQTRHALAKRLDRSTAFWKLSSSFDNGQVSSIIQIRNDFSHGTEPSGRAAEDLLTTWRPRLRNFVHRVWQNLNFDIFLPSSLHFDGDKFDIDGYVLVGDSINLPAKRLEADVPLISGQPYLAKPEQQWVNLYPLLVLEPAVEPNAWHTLIFDGIKGEVTGHPSTGEESLRFLDIWSGQRNAPATSNPTYRMLPSPLTQQML